MLEWQWCEIYEYGLKVIIEQDKEKGKEKI